MRKVFLVFALMLAAFGHAVAGEIVCNDKTIPTNGVVTLTLSKRYTAKPVWLNVNGALPNNGNVTVSWLHTYANGNVQTNSSAAISLSSGAVSTNLTSVFNQYLYAGEALIFKFSTATNGAFQIVGELHK